MIETEEINGKMESPVRKIKHSKKQRFSKEFDNQEFIITQLKGKLKLLTAEMEDGVKRMNVMTLEMSEVKKENVLFKDKIAQIENDNNVLTLQIEEMINEKAERDAVIEEFGSAVEARIIEWKGILDEKDAMISRLKENLMVVGSDQVSRLTSDNTNHYDVKKLLQDIQERDEIISELQSKLAEAVVEINESTFIIEKFRSDSRSDSGKKSSRAEREIQKKLEEANKKISTLESLLQQAETDAKVKSEQLSEALSILNKFEDEDTSLTQSLREIKELKESLVKKNQHVEDLVHIINRLEEENSKFEEEVIVLRNKFGDTEEESSISDLIARRQKIQEEKLAEMKRIHEKIQSENVSLKFQIRKLKCAVKEAFKNKLSRINGISSDGENSEEITHSSESKKEHMELKCIRETVKWAVEENEALRQGLHEILESIHNQDGKSIVTIQSETLESLLQALDARHLAGWYHPAMRLQGKVNYLQGSNAELRQQLQQLRQHQLILQGEMQKSSEVEEGECPRINNSPQRLAIEMGSITNSPTHTVSQSTGSSCGSISEKSTAPKIRECKLDSDILYATENVYREVKTDIMQTNELRRVLNISEKHRKLLENEVEVLRQKYMNYIPPEQFNELKAQYLKTKMLLRSEFESSIGNSLNVEQELRDQLSSLHKKLAELTTMAKNDSCQSRDSEFHQQIEELRIENKGLKRNITIFEDEISMYRAIDAKIVSEFRKLRHFLRNSSSIDDNLSQDTVAKLTIELTNLKIRASELQENKKILEIELESSRDELFQLKKELLAVQSLISDNKFESDSNSSSFIDVIDFLQTHYAGSTSLSTWERFETKLNNLNEDRKANEELKEKITRENESIQIQEETLRKKLEMIEQFTNSLNQGIKKEDIKQLIDAFTNTSVQVSSDIHCKSRINNLELEVHKANEKIKAYESQLLNMEYEIINVQKSWKVQKSDSNNNTNSYSVISQKLSKIVQTDHVKNRSIEILCKLCCQSVTKSCVDESEYESTSQDSVSDNVDRLDIPMLQEQLRQALTLASERSVTLLKYESQLAEHRARTERLSKLLEEKNAIFGTEDSAIKLEESKETLNTLLLDSASSNEALHSTIRTLQKIIQQKEETIERYQVMLRQDRDKYAEAARLLQEEIKCLKKQLSNKIDLNASGMKQAHSEKDFDSTDKPTEESSLLRERIARMETELTLGSELAERWHRLADDRLKHMENMRERLEEQHRSEIESYRAEINTRQRDLEDLKCQLLENRRVTPSLKNEVHLFMQELQIKDNKLADEIENDLEDHAATSHHLSTTYEGVRYNSSEFESTQIQIDNLRKQLQASMERERSYKNEVTELQQKLSRKYMADKIQEKKISKREIQLDRRVKDLEEEIREKQEILNRYIVIQNTRRTKTAEDLGLWDKLKRWQQTAEKLKEKLKEKCEECEKLQSNDDKLRALISCMEREKWYLRSKYKGTIPHSADLENSPIRKIVVPAWMPKELESHDAEIIDDLKKECQELRTRLKELMSQINTSENEKETRKLEIQEKELELVEYNSKETISVLEERLKKLEDAREILEKENLRLESENFELRLEVEKAQANMPRMQDKINHLEKYIEILKSEKFNDSPYNYNRSPKKYNNLCKSKLELEKTIVSLKKVIDKLQIENKKLKNRDRPINPCSNCNYYQEQIEDSRQRVALLESELELAEKKLVILENDPSRSTSDEDNAEEIRLLRSQLKRKSELLLKVRDLLAEAASNEKALRQRIHQLEFRQTLDIIPEYTTAPYMPATPLDI